MIVTCERCATQFQLEDVRVPKGGVRVRCSRCKHAFHVEPPSRGELRGVHRVAQRALEQAEQGPEIAQDVEKPPETLAAGRSEPRSDDEESDWEFEGPPPTEEKASEDAVPDPEDAPFGAPGLGEAEVGAAEAAPEAAPEKPPEPALSEAGLELDSEEDAESLFEKPPAEPEPAPPPAPPLLAAESAASAEAAPADELGSPEAWDLFDEEAAPAPALGARSLASPVRSAEIAPGPATDALEATDTPWRWLRGIGAVLGWMATLALVGIGLMQGLAPRAPAEASSVSLEVGGLRLENVSPRWIDNAVHGPIYVVSGRLRNPGPAPVSGPGVALVLRDASGARVGEPLPLGPPLERRILREADAETLRATALRDGAPLRPGLAPGEDVRFEVVVSPLPTAAERFDFEVLDDAPPPAALSSAARPRSPLPSAE